MSIFTRLFGDGRSNISPRAQDSGGGQVIATSADLERAVAAAVSGGASVTAESAMRNAAVYACVRIRAGVPANMPLDLKRRVDDRTRVDASDDPLWAVLRRRPNGWQTPSQFKRLLQAHVLLRGNGYAQKVVSRGRVIGLNPLHPDRMTVTQNRDLTLKYDYVTGDGRRVTFNQNEIFHLVGMTLDGVVGVSVISYARNAIGLAVDMERHGAATFRNGARPSSVLKHPGRLGKEGQEFLRASLDDYRTGGDREGKVLVLEEGMDVSNISMTAEDAQWIESRKFSRSDIAMFFGVPPHMIGDTEKSTSWGSGIDSQTQGFLAFSAEDDLTAWEETVNRDLINPEQPNLYARFNRSSLVRGDIKTRWESYVRGMQWGVYSPNEVRGMEDENPRDGGDVYYDPPNTAGGSAIDNGGGNEPAKTA